VSKRTLALALALFAILAPAAYAKAKNKFELTVKGVDGIPVAAAAVTLSATTGEAFSATGVTDEKGRYKAEVPDFDRVYALEVKKDGFVTRKEKLDFPAQGLKAGATAEVEVPLLVRGPIEVYNEGVQALQAKDLEAAAVRFEESLAMKPDFKEAMRALALVYIDIKQPEKALIIADKALALDPVDPIALRDRYEALSALGRTADAEAALYALAAHEKSSDVAKLLFNAGADAWNAKDAAAARKHFEAALATDPKLYQAHVALSEIHIAEKKYDDAVVALDAAIAVAPRNFKAYERKIEVLKAAGKAAEAAEVEKALAALKAGG
jgi:tetratricopeptide (TPR) repeat protein